MFVVPPPLRSGDAISLVAPAGPVDASALARATAELERRGYRIKTYRDVTARTGYLAGNDAERIAEFNQAIADPETVAVLPIRGGYGAARIVAHLDYAVLASRPKLLCGFSDITALHAAIHRHAGVATFHGPNLQDGIGGVDGLHPAVAASYWQALTGEQQHPSSDHQTDLPTPVALIPGEATGPLVGGNLAVLCGLIGTPFEPDTSGAILLLEDIGEAPYRIDRLLAQLQLAGKFDNLLGIVLGQFNDCSADGQDATEQLEELFRHYFSQLGIPVLRNYSVGHTSLNLTVPLGVPVRLDAAVGRLDLAATYTVIQQARSTQSTTT